ncbi:MAG: ABC transporter substrate-binding protein [Proteobacteria bacterium]|nr:ABC transporter substrate-binding protein [Pseudomonadota bacterium]
MLVKHLIRLTFLVGITALVLVWGACPSAGQDPPDQTPPPEVVIGGLFDITGRTSDLGRDYAQGAVEAVMYINANGGINGAPIRLVSKDFGYDGAKALKLYQQFKHVNKVFAILGWGMADTAALAPHLGKDRVVFMSAHCDPELTDPKKSPYNFFIGPTYTDQARLAMHYAKDSGGRKVCFIYPEHPFGQGPLAAGKDYAQKLGLEIGPDVVVDLRATDASQQLLQIKEFAPDFAWIGGTTPSAAVIVKDAAKLGFKTRFLINGWGFDDKFPELAGQPAEGRALGLMSVRPFGFDAPGTKAIRETIGERTYSLQFNKAWASMMVLWEGLKRAKRPSGPTLKAALETLVNFDSGGLTPPLTYTPQDHRGTTACGLYGIKDGQIVLITDLNIERKSEYLGW